ncbi:U1 small nuclear ribonucleoprotein 70 kDa-like isoform X1 [Branchiostoma lanceolatum]|uniref:U1 small nuclear ribonucleoprotein 70 kDa-like isoform X1 n=1 Tax=Branchiostoma lanceolatum TaxID=7740 RepID=UPI003451D1B7
MTQYLPPNLLALFAPREPIPYLPPTDKLPCEKIRRAPYSEVTPFLPTFEDPKDTPPPTRAETRQERLERKRKEKLEAHANRLEEKVSEWDPANDTNASGDAYKTLFVARINYDTSESKLRREFEVYGPIRSIKMTKDVNTGKPRGYAFIEYEHERDMHSAYKHADGKKIDGRRVLVDVERGRTVKGWRPRRLGGGLGGTRKGGPEVNVKHSGREDPTRGLGGGEDRFGGPPAFPASTDERGNLSRDRERGGGSGERERSRERGERPERPERRRSRDRSRERGERRRSRERGERGERGERPERGDRPERHRSRDTSKEPRRRSRSRDRERRRDRDRKRGGGGGGEEEKMEGEEAGEVVNGEEGPENEGSGGGGGGKRERERDRDRDRKDRDRDRKKSRRDRDRDRDRRDRDRDRDRDRGRDKNRDKDRGGDVERAPDEEREQGEYDEGIVIKQEPLDEDEKQQQEQVEGIPEELAFYPPPPPPAEPEDGETMDY